jgi:hypothetical protein
MEILDLRIRFTIPLDVKVISKYQPGCPADKKEETAASLCFNQLSNIIQGYGGVEV